MSDDDLEVPLEDGYQRRPPAGYKKHGFSSRSEREKSYENPMHMKALVRDPDKAEEQEEALTLAYNLLWNAELMDSKTQFAACMLQAYRTPIPLQEAAAICQVSRQWLRKLAGQGRIIILKSTHKKQYIQPEDVRRILDGRV